MNATHLNAAEDFPMGESAQLASLCDAQRAEMAVVGEPLLEHCAVCDISTADARTCTVCLAFTDDSKYCAGCLLRCSECGEMVCDDHARCVAGTWMQCFECERLHAQQSGDMA